MIKKLKKKIKVKRVKKVKKVKVPEPSPREVYENMGKRQRRRKRQEILGY